MQFREWETARRVARTGFVLLALVSSLALNSAIGFAQTCADCELYAVTELNLRQDPSLEADVLRFIPAGTAVERAEGDEVNGYAPVVYDSVPGWAIALGLVASPEEVDAVGGGLSPEAPVEAPVASNGADARFTLTSLVLRSAPDAESEPILVMPEGATVTLTREGSENGYVTVDYDGTPGWAYADLLGGDQ